MIFFSMLSKLIPVVVGLALALSAVISIQNTYAATTAVGTLPDGRLQVFEVRNDGTVWTRWKLTTDPNSQWAPWQIFGSGGSSISVGSLSDGRLQVFLTKLDGHVQTRWKATTDPNAQWTPWSPFS
jgi:hypothetical protein